MIKEVVTPKLKSPILIVAWPGMGEVAYKAALFLKEALRFRMFAKLEAHEFFNAAAVVVEKGIANMPVVPAGFFYYYKPEREGQDLILFLGEAQPPLEKAEALAQTILGYVKKFKVRLVISCAAKPESIDHKASVSVWGVATHKELLERLKKMSVRVLSEGQISGLNGIILGVAKMYKMRGVCFLGEIPFYTVQIENPKASREVLKKVNGFLNLQLDLTPLDERAKFIEEEIDRLISYLKGEAPSQQGPLPLGEEDIEKIKKDLAAFTKVPQSARESIDALLKEARKDISKARELKQELDRWNVYKEYEDKFLNLFKKKNKENRNH